MHQILLRLRSHWGAYSALPDPLTGFKGPTSTAKKGKGEDEGGKEEMVRRKGRKGEMEYTD